MSRLCVDIHASKAYPSRNSGSIVSSGPLQRRGIAIRQRVAPTGAVVVLEYPVTAGKLVRGGSRMFENLSERLGGVFERLTRQGALTEEDLSLIHI